MFRSTGVVRRVAGIIALFLLFLVRTPAVEAQTPTDEIANCITDAWDVYLECLDDLPWWAELLCAARFTSDAILCLPKEVMDAVKAA
jgi:hypothetical protein